MADKAYNSKDNYNAVKEVGGIAYIPFRVNATGGGGRHNLGSKAKVCPTPYHYFQLHQDEFLMAYNNRSNIESTFMAIKFKLGDCLKGKTLVSQTNELYCKLIAYNVISSHL